MPGCSPYDASQPARGENDAQCPKNWQVIKAQQGIPAGLVVTINDPALASIPYIPSATTHNTSQNPFDPDFVYSEANNYIARLFFREHPGDISPQVALARRISTYEFQIDIESGHVAYPGLYIADLALYGIYGHPDAELTDPTYVAIKTATGIPASTADEDGQELRMVWYKRMYFEIEPNNSQNIGFYPLTISELRLAMRDECAASNFLIDDLEYSDKEIFHAIHNAVDYWNETPPSVGSFTYASFPYRYHWRQAAMASLLKMAAIHKLRNWLPYTGGGVNVNDQSIWQQYMQIGIQMWDGYREFVQNKKVEININGSFGGFMGGATF